MILFEGIYRNVKGQVIWFMGDELCSFSLREMGRKLEKL